MSGRQDRVLYATDLVVPPKDDTQKALDEWNMTYERETIAIDQKNRPFISRAPANDF